MTEVQTPARVESTQETQPQVNLWHRLGEHLNGFRQEAVINLGCISAAAVFAMTLGKQEKAFASPYIAGDTPGNIGGALGIESPSLSRQEAKPELIGPQVWVVCTHPINVPICETERVAEAKKGMNALLGHPEHGAPGFSLRIKDGLKVVQLDKTTSEIVEMARNVSEDEVARQRLAAYFEEQVHNKLGNLPEVDFATFLTGTPPLGKNGYATSPFGHWNGVIDGHNVLVQYLTSTSDPGNPYHGFRAPHAGMLADIIHNDGFLPRCAPDFIDEKSKLGYSNAFRDLLGPDINSYWFFAVLGRSYFEPGRTGGCLNLAENPRFAWLINSSTNGGGLLKYYLENADGTKTPIELDPGSRLPAGSAIEARYLPVVGKEKLKSWGGACTASPCEFIANQVVSLRANVEQLPQATTYEITVQAKGLSVIGLGKKCIEFCKVNKKQGSTFEIRAVDLPKKPVMKILGWLGCDKVINRKNAGKVCQVKNLSRNRKLTAKTAPAR